MRQNARFLLDEMGAKVNTKKMGKVAWRKAQEPTLHLRLRALCNQVKHELLGFDHDPYSPQTDSIIDHKESPTKDGKTWEGWWTATQIPQSSQLEKMNRIAPGCSNWLENRKYGTPIQRHFLALDCRALEITKKGDWYDQKLNLQQEALDALSEVWSRFTRYMGQDAKPAFEFERQIAPYKLTPASMVNATKNEKLHVAMGNLNPYRFEFSGDAYQRYQPSDKFGLFPFMIAIADESRLRQEWLRDIWILDCASLVALMGTEIAVHEDNPSTALGSMFIPFAALNRIYWDHLQGIITPAVRLLPTLVQDGQREWVQMFLQVRQRYYALLRELGINFTDLYPITQPIKVWGAKRIMDNIIFSS
jgi:hypothetical protein